MRAVGLPLSATVLVLSALAHILTFVPGVPISMDDTWPLHVWAMAAFALLIFDGIRFQRRARRREGESLFTFWSRSSRDGQRSFGRLVEMMPLPVVVVVVALVAYTFINFFAFGLGVRGTAAEEDGRYYLHDHGTRLRDLSRAEYVRYRALEVRGFSGHWMLFSAIPTVYFVFIRPPLAARRDEEDGRAADP